MYYLFRLLITDVDPKVDCALISTRCPSRIVSFLSLHLKGSCWSELKCEKSSGWGCVADHSITPLLAVISLCSSPVSFTMTQTSSSMLFDRVFPVLARSGSERPLACSPMVSSIPGETSYFMTKNTISFPSFGTLADEISNSTTHETLPINPRRNVRLSPRKAMYRYDSDYQSSDENSAGKFSAASKVPKLAFYRDIELGIDAGYEPDREDDRLKLKHSISARRAPRGCMTSRLRIVSAPLPVRLPLPPSPPPKPYICRRRDHQPASAMGGTPTRRRPRSNAIIAAKVKPRPFFGLGLGPDLVMPKGRLLQSPARAASNPMPRKGYPLGMSAKKFIPSCSFFSSAKLLRRGDQKTNNNSAIKPSVSNLQRALFPRPLI